MRFQVTLAGVWQTRPGYAIFWDKTSRLGAEWKVNTDMSVVHTDGPASAKPPMHIRHTAMLLAQ